MKIKTCDYNKLYNGISDLLDKGTRGDKSIEEMYRYVKGQMPSMDDKKAVRWSIFNSFIDSLRGDVVNPTDFLYEYLDDSHIDTALKNIFMELQKEGY